MNIDLRNIDFEEELKEIMRKENFATASKCIRSVVLEHEKLKRRIKELNEMLSKERRENITLLEERKNLANAMRLLNSIIPERAIL